MAYTSAYKFIYTTLRAALLRNGVYVGGTAAYPRVELHSFQEGQPLEKGQSLRSVTCSVESMSSTSLSEAVTMNEENISRIIALEGNADNNWEIVAIEPTLLQDITETMESQALLYRLIQNFEITIQKL